MKIYQQKINSIGLFSLLMSVAGLCMEPGEPCKVNNPATLTPAMPVTPNAIIALDMPLPALYSSQTEDEDCDSEDVDDEGNDDLVPLTPEVCPTPQDVQRQLENMSIHERPTKQEDEEEKSRVAKRSRKIEGPIQPTPNTQ